MRMASEKDDAPTGRIINSWKANLFPIQNNNQNYPHFQNSKQYPNDLNRIFHVIDTGMSTTVDHIERRNWQNELFPTVSTQISNMSIQYNIIISILEKKRRLYLILNVCLTLLFVVVYLFICLFVCCLFVCLLLLLFICLFVCLFAVGLSTCREELLFEQRLPYTPPLKHQELHSLPVCLKFWYSEWEISE
jgi:hypothetical protein